MKNRNEQVELSLQDKTHNLSSPDHGDKKSEQKQEEVPSTDPVLPVETENTLAPTPNFAAMPFNAAADYWFSQHTQGLAPNSITNYERYLRPLRNYFKDTKVKSITFDHICQYRKHRQNGDTDARWAGINHECGLLRMMLKKAGCWKDMSDFYKKLPRPRNVKLPGRALTPEEATRLVALFRELATERSGFEVAACCGLISMKTTAGPAELLSLQLGDIYLNDKNPRFEIPRRGAKRRTRARTIYLNGDALWAMQRLVERAKKLGCTKPNHYLMPGHPKDLIINPCRPQIHYKTAMKGILAMAGIENFRTYDFRHHAITRLLEDSRLGERTAEHQAGWIRPDMKERYGHARKHELLKASAVLAEDEAVQEESLDDVRALKEQIAQLQLQLGRQKKQRAPVKNVQNPGKFRKVS